MPPAYYEYAITAGEGTLVAHGTWNHPTVQGLVASLMDNEVLIIAPCDDDCPTGK